MRVRRRLCGHPVRAAGAAFAITAAFAKPCWTTTVAAEPNTESAPPATAFAGSGATSVRVQRGQ